MWVCDNCGERFETPDYMEICWEDFYGVGSMFINRNYGTITVCPCCGSENIEERSEEWED